MRVGTIKGVRAEMCWRGYIIRIEIWLYSGKYFRDQIGSEERIQMISSEVAFRNPNQ